MSIYMSPKLLRKIARYFYNFNMDLGQLNYGAENNKGMVSKGDD